MLLQSHLPVCKIYSGLKCFEQFRHMPSDVHLKLTLDLSLRSVAYDEMVDDWCNLEVDPDKPS